jgi:drug/metabolite transporter (DMT)-like permease
MSTHTKAILQALFVTFLWSTSWVMIKIGLNDIPALTFAGMRYFLAFLILLPLALRHWSVIKNLTGKQWRNLIVLGLIYYSITQGTQFIALKDLPAITFSLMLNFTGVVTAFLGILFLNERMTRRQWCGMAVFLGGVLIYFYPVVFPEGQIFALVIGMVSVFSNAVSSVLGRFVNRGGVLPPVVVTVISMGIGSSLMLVGGVATEGIPTLQPDGILIVFWLALINTALAFTLWNHTLRTLSAVESSIINNTMLIQIAVLAWLFLGETITEKEMAGLGVAVVGILIFQLRRVTIPRLQRQAPLADEVQRSDAGA